MGPIDRFTVAVLALVTGACGGAPFVELTADTDGGGGGAEASVVVQDDAGGGGAMLDHRASSQEASREASDGQDANAADADAGQSPEDAGAHHDAGQQEAGRPCVTTLSGVGGGDFRVSFTIETTASGGTYALVNQRSGCDMASAWWDVTLTTTGGIELATDDGSGASYVFVQSGAAVNDGAPHTVVAARTNGSIWLSKDGVVDSVATPDSYSFGPLPPLTLGSSACSAESPLSSRGTITNLCLTTP